ncbi:hypothetical protein [Thermomonas paludicola]|uniref:hypothetical protein n=1 Tax=Thermomonas paludicola TaxID=2884874 RepID=UPI0021151897|nr:hypothetical protein [Thermomonas paludicola]
MQQENTPQDGAESVWASLMYTARQLSKIAAGVTVLFALVAGILWLAVQVAMLFMPEDTAAAFGMLVFTLLLGASVVFMKRRYDVEHQSDQSQSKANHGRRKGERR